MAKLIFTFVLCVCMAYGLPRFDGPPEVQPVVDSEESSDSDDASVSSEESEAVAVPQVLPLEEYIAAILPYLPQEKRREIVAQVLPFNPAEQDGENIAHILPFPFNPTEQDGENIAHILPFNPAEQDGENIAHILPFPFNPSYQDVDVSAQVLPLNTAEQDGETDIHILPYNAGEQDGESVANILPFNPEQDEIAHILPIDINEPSLDVDPTLTAQQQMTRLWPSISSIVANAPNNTAALTFTNVGSLFQGLLG